jgi:hypothetical protein
LVQFIAPDMFMARFAFTQPVEKGVPVIKLRSHKIENRKHLLNDHRALLERMLVMHNI